MNSYNTNVFPPLSIKVISVGTTSVWLFQIRWTWYVSTNSSRSNSWIQKIFCSMMGWHFHVGTLVLTYDVSAMCQDTNLFLPEADSKDLVVPVCHHHTPANGYLANCVT